MTPDEGALVAAHALGALEPEEAAAAERLVATSPACRALFGETLETAAALALATASAAPPPSLRERILAAARREREA
jgi:anti-sigma-K factor RskA